MHIDSEGTYSIKKKKKFISTWKQANISIPEGKKKRPEMELFPLNNDPTELHHHETQQTNKPKQLIKFYLNQSDL